MQNIMQVGNLFQKEVAGKESKKEEEEDLESSDSDLDLNELSIKEKEKGCKSCSTCGGSTGKDKKKKKKERKPEVLRKQLFEIILRKRIFLTDRLEKIEKTLITYGIVDEK